MYSLKHPQDRLYHLTKWGEGGRTHKIHRASFIMGDCHWNRVPMGPLSLSLNAGCKPSGQFLEYRGQAKMVSKVYGGWTSRASEVKPAFWIQSKNIQVTLLLYC